MLNFSTDISSELNESFSFFGAFNFLVCWTYIKLLCTVERAGFLGDDLIGNVNILRGPAAFLPPSLGYFLPPGGWWWEKDDLQPSWEHISVPSSFAVCKESLCVLQVIKYAIVIWRSCPLLKQPRLDLKNQ